MAVCKLGRYILYPLNSIFYSRSEWRELMQKYHGTTAFSFTALRLIRSGTLNRGNAVRTVVSYTFEKHGPEVARDSRMATERRASNSPCVRMTIASPLGFHNPKPCLVCQVRIGSVESRDASCASIPPDPTGTKGHDCASNAEDVPHLVD